MVLEGVLKQMMETESVLNTSIYIYEGSVKWQLPSLVITDDICLWVNEGVKEEKNAHGKRGVTQWQW